MTAILFHGRSSFDCRGILPRFLPTGKEVVTAAQIHLLQCLHKQLDMKADGWDKEMGGKVGKKTIVIPSCKLRRAGCKLVLTAPNSLTRVSCDRVGIKEQRGQVGRGNLRITACSLTCQDPAFKQARLFLSFAVLILEDTLHAM